MNWFLQVEKCSLVNQQFVYKRTQMLEDLMRNPSQIKDMVPFIVGLQEDDNRTGLSWEYADMFHWAAFEEKRLELEYVLPYTITEFSPVL
ncbi:hypothetical protein ANCCEY_13588 [Ancylostoma ceylanicum]|uniref:Uncharacterized protein n=1 Tax=Ancylostoma ceylanicum TaxID=53326 RepID=A0A0D6LBX7_9BILA|nr:hypothetical protein ANCCEY_13588 [Ancylostoma ceylanicum]